MCYVQNIQFFYTTWKGKQYPTCGLDLTFKIEFFYLIKIIFLKRLNFLYNKHFIIQPLYDF